MRKTVLVPVSKLFCDAHIARDGSEVEATSSLKLGKDTWHLCLEHDVSFGRYLCDALGAPSESEVTQADPEPVPVVEPVSEPEPEPEAVPVVESDPEPVRSVMIAGEVPGYDWEDAREAVRNLGYEVVGRADETTCLLILGEGGDRNATKLRDASKRNIPVMDVRKPGRFIRAGVIPLPQHRP
ncbi:hypothetical protein ACFV4E_12010 [Streptomyces hygroscopicus]|uniref:hypothetical protein n=1 Tax=Streptomyces hygroscopicus TaxID=1912 RepID=UPI00369B171A